MLGKRSSINLANIFNRNNFNFKLPAIALPDNLLDAKACLKKGKFKYEPQLVDNKEN